MSCYQLSIGGSGTTSPPTVSLPGAYKASDPGVSAKQDPSHTADANNDVADSHQHLPVAHELRL